jgi:hypothetical protein
MNAPIAVVRSWTERKVPRRMAWRVMMPKKISTMLSQEQPVGVECSVTRGLSFSHALHGGVLVRSVVVQDDVQLDAGMGGGDLLQELQELLVAVPGIARIRGDIPVATSSAANSVVVPLRL